MRSVDVGYVNDELFLNTSAIGVYIRFVRIRDRIERFTGYWLASFLAGLRILASPRPIHLQLQLPDELRVYDAPLFFVGVGERVLTPPKLGARLPPGPGARALHVVVPRGPRQAQRFTHAYARIDRGHSIGKNGFGVDSVLADHFRLEVPAPSTTVATDGEIKRSSVPLEYRLAHDALKVVAGP